MRASRFLSSVNSADPTREKSPTSPVLSSSEQELEGDSGTSPRQAFGSPRDYARTFTPATTAGPGDTPLYLVGWLIGTLAGALLIICLSAQGQEVVLGFLPPVAGIVLASVILVAWGVLVLVRLTRRPKPNPTDSSGSDIR